MQAQWRRPVVTAFATAGMLFLGWTGSGALEGLNGPAAVPEVRPSQILLEPKASFDSATLVIGAPDGTLRERSVQRGRPISIPAQGLADGTYTYELTLVITPPADAWVQLEEADADGRLRVLSDEARQAGPWGYVESGSFAVIGGRFVTPRAEPETVRPLGEVER